ncbi:MAG: PAS domain S-box protein [Chloroflexota bacterium]
MISIRPIYYLGFALVGISLAELVLLATTRQASLLLVKEGFMVVLMAGLVVLLVWHSRVMARTESWHFSRPTIMKNVSEAIIRLDPQLKIVGWNHAAESIYGWTAAEVLGKEFDEVVTIIYPDGDSYKRAEQRLLDADIYEGEVLHHKRNGHQFHVWVTVTAIRQPAGGQVMGYVAVVRDLSTHYELQRNQHLSNTQVESLINNASIGLMSINRDYIIMAARGKQLDRLLGQVASFNVVGRSAKVLFADQKRILLRMESAFKGRNLSDVLDINGFAFDLRFDPIYDGEAVTGITVVVFDVTDNQVFDQTLQQYALRLETMRQIYESILALAEPAEIAETTLDYLPFLVPHVASLVTVLDVDESTDKITHTRPLAFRDVNNRVQMLSASQVPVTWYRSQAAVLNQSGVQTRDIDPAATPIDRFLFDLGAKHMVAVPLRRGEKAIGLLTIGVENHDMISEGRHEIIVEVGDVLAVAINQALLNQRVQAYATTLEKNVVNLLNEGHVARSLSDTVISHSSDAIVLLDNTLSVVQANPAFSRMFGFEAAGMCVDMLFTDMAAPKRQTELENLLRRAIQTREPVRFDMDIHRHQTEIPITVSIAASPIETIYSGTDGMVLNLRDITEEKRKQAELLRAFEQQRELGELRSRFLSTVSHEFRTPLTVIQSSMELLTMSLPGEKTDKQIRHIDRIHDSLQTMVTLLTDVSAMHRMERDAGAATPVQLDPVQLAGSVAESLSIVDEDHTIQFIAGDTAPRTIEADGTLLRQIMTNLITNAIKYSPQGAAVQVMTRYTRNHFVFEVIDHGRGIPPDDQEHLFDPFFRASNVGQEPGSGLGLAIVQRAVDAHYGTISFTSEPGEGTHFKVFIPVIYRGIEKEALV